MSAKPIKISKRLYHLADEEGMPLVRSAAKQVEYWAIIGRVVEKNLIPQQVNELLQEKIEILVRPLKSQSVDFEEVFGQLEADRKSGKLTSQVVSGSEWFRMSEKHPGLLEKQTSDGQILVGKIENGVFVVAQNFDENGK